MPTARPADALSSPPRPIATVGFAMLAIAAIHQIAGIAIGLGLDPSAPFLAEGSAPPLLAMLRDGLFDGVGVDPWRNAMVWFLLWGFLLGVLGLLAHHTERAGLALPRSFALAFGALCVLGVVLMPASGFWLGIVPVAMVLRRAGVRDAATHGRST
jgi:hypothetical protein